MSRESTLDEAIAKAKREGDRQLAEWLRAARGAESAARWYSDKLREAHRAERGLLDENKRLRDENKDLRDLVRVMAYCMQADNDCDRCAMNDARMRLCIDPYFACDGLYERLRELGVEADE